jgi:hypothetical protein
MDDVAEVRANAVDLMDICPSPAVATGTARFPQVPHLIGCGTCACEHDLRIVSKPTRWASLQLFWVTDFVLMHLALLILVYAWLTAM